MTHLMKLRKMTEKNEIISHWYLQILSEFNLFHNQRKYDSNN
jgi:hypothetical protein